MNKRDETNDYKYNFNINQEDKEEKEHFVNKIKITRAWIYLCFCCIRKKNNLENILLNEGKNIISGYLDIFNCLSNYINMKKIKEKLKEEKMILSKCRIFVNLN